MLSMTRALGAGLLSAVLAAAVPGQVQADGPDERLDDGYSVVVTTHNILASPHRAGGQDRAFRAARFAQGEEAGVSAFQEVAGDQFVRLRQAMPGYGFFPRRTYGTRGSAIQIAWRKDDLKRLDSGAVMRPFLGWERPTPWVKLRHRETGRGFYVVAIHNSPRDRETERDISTARQIALVKKLLRTDQPVFVVGDVNEREEFCVRMAAATPLVSMNGGTQRRPCPVPRFGGPDWMLGSGAEFDGFSKVYNGISDHPALRATATVASTR